MNMVPREFFVFVGEDELTSRRSDGVEIDNFATEFAGVISTLWRERVGRRGKRRKGGRWRANE